MVLVQRVYHLADGLIAHSQAGCDALLEMGIASERITVIPLGHYVAHAGDTQPSPVEARRRLNLPINTPLLLFFGQIKEVKGLDVLLHALDRLATWRTDVRLTIAGQVWKDDWSTYATLIDELDLESRLDLRLRYIPDDEMADLLAAADVVVLPYRHIYQSAVLLTVMSYGRPVVASRVGGLAEVVQDGETGYLVPPEDPVALAEALDRILSNPRAAQAMGLRGRALVEERYSWTWIAAATRQLYEQVLDR